MKGTETVLIVLIGIVVGIILAKYLLPRARVIVRPTLSNAGKKTYIDDQGQRYIYQVEWLE